MLRLDYISCLLTILSTVMVGRRLWAGWVVAAVNSVLICLIGVRTSQLGFVPANVFCIVLYAWNLHHWRNAQPRAALYPVTSLPKSADFRPQFLPESRQLRKKLEVCHVVGNNGAVLKPTNKGAIEADDSGRLQQNTLRARSEFRSPGGSRVP